MLLACVTCLLAWLAGWRGSRARRNAPLSTLLNAPPKNGRCTTWRRWCRTRRTTTCCEGAAGQPRQRQETLAAPSASCLLRRAATTHSAPLDLLPGSPAIPGLCEHACCWRRAAYSIGGNAAAADLFTPLILALQCTLDLNRCFKLLPCRCQCRFMQPPVGPTPPPAAPPAPPPPPGLPPCEPL